MKKPLHTLPNAYQKLRETLGEIPLIANGSVMEVPPRTENGNTTYIWTRKVKSKTVTVALSKEQFHTFSKAIEANRRIEDTLNKMRAISEKYVLETLPGVTRRKKV